MVGEEKINILVSSSQDSARFTGGKRIDYILYRAGAKAGVSVRTQSCVLPLSHRIPSSLSARLGRGREVSYSDHEAVLAVLNLETDIGSSGDTGSYNGHTKDHNDQTITQALQIIERASRQTYRDKTVYSVVSLVMFLLFCSTFSQLLLNVSSVILILDCAMFLLRAALALLGFYSLCMATLFNRYLLPPTVLLAITGHPENLT